MSLRNSRALKRAIRRRMVSRTTRAIKSAKSDAVLKNAQRLKDQIDRAFGSIAKLISDAQRLDDIHDSAKEPVVFYLKKADSKRDLQALNKAISTLTGVRSGRWGKA